jgi:hypothetical protein
VNCTDFALPTDARGDRFLAAAEAVLEGQGQVLLDLQRSTQPLGEIAASSMMEATPASLALHAPMSHAM